MFVDAAIYIASALRNQVPAFIGSRQWQGVDFRLAFLHSKLMAPGKSTSRFFLASGCSIATTARYRCVHLREQLQHLGYESDVVDCSEDSKIDPNVAHEYDVFVLYRLAMSSPLERLIGLAHSLGKPVIFDVDDLIFDPTLVEWHRGVDHLSAADRERHIEGMRLYRATLLACDAALMATPLLAQFARELGRPAFVHRNALGNEMLALAEQLYGQRQSREPNEKLVIGYGSGTPTHDVDFKEADAALVNTLERYPQVELWVAGPLAISQTLIDFGKRVIRFPLTDWRAWFELLSRMDIALAPLEMGNIFCRAKSEIKFVEAAALGVPVVASNIDPFKDSMRNGRDGLLVSNEDEWTQALALLIDGSERRSEIGENARRSVLQRYSVETRAEELSAILPSLIDSVPLPK